MAARVVEVRLFAACEDTQQVMLRSTLTPRYEKDRVDYILGINKSCTHIEIEAHTRRIPVWLGMHILARS